MDRALLHRRHADEAFLADVSRTGEDTFTAVALLPAFHPHYGGHTGPSRHLDPLLLLECARQAETYAAHALFGVENDAHFVLRRWSAEFASRPPGRRGNPLELVLTARTANATSVGGRLRSLEYVFDLWLGGRRAGRVRMDVGYVSSGAYRLLRGRRRQGGAPPSSDTVAPTEGRPAEPASVGRTRPTDVVLLEVAREEGRYAARLRVPVENPSMFDHAQDHVPAMVLMEAARQFAVLVTGRDGGDGPDRTRVLAVEGSFDNYAELDNPVGITATPPVRTDAGWSVGVCFHQSGSEIARTRAVVASERTRGKGASWARRRF